MTKKSKTYELKGGNLKHPMAEIAEKETDLEHKKAEYNEELKEAQEYQEEAQKQSIQARNAHNEVVAAEQNAAIAKNQYNFDYNRSKI